MGKKGKVMTEFVITRKREGVIVWMARVVRVDWGFALQETADMKYWVERGDFLPSQLREAIAKCEAMAK